MSCWLSADETKHRVFIDSGDRVASTCNTQPKINEMQSDFSKYASTPTFKTWIASVHKKLRWEQEHTVPAPASPPTSLQVRVTPKIDGSHIDVLYGSTTLPMQEDAAADGVPLLRQPPPPPRIWAQSRSRVISHTGDPKTDCLDFAKWLTENEPAVRKIFERLVESILQHPWHEGQTEAQLLANYHVCLSGEWCGTKIQVLALRDLPERFFVLYGLALVPKPAPPPPAVPEGPEAKDEDSGDGGTGTKRARRPWEKHLWTAERFGALSDHAAHIYNVWECADWLADEVIEVDLTSKPTQVVAELEAMAQRVARACPIARVLSGNQVTDGRGEGLVGMVVGYRASVDGPIIPLTIDEFGLFKVKAKKDPKAPPRAEEKWARKAHSATRVPPAARAYVRATATADRFLQAEHEVCTLKHERPGTEEFKQAFLEWMEGDGLKEEAGEHLEQADDAAQAEAQHALRAVSTAYLKLMNAARESVRVAGH